jgi:hypothetical protein
MPARAPGISASAVAFDNRGTHHICRKSRSEPQVARWVAAKARAGTAAAGDSPAVTVSEASPRLILRQFQAAACHTTYLCLAKTTKKAQKWGSYDPPKKGDPHHPPCSRLRFARVPRQHASDGQIRPGRGAPANGQMLAGATNVQDSPHNELFPRSMCTRTFRGSSTSSPRSRQSPGLVDGDAVLRTASPVTLRRNRPDSRALQVAQALSCGAQERELKYKRGKSVDPPRPRLEQLLIRA